MPVAPDTAVQLTPADRGLETPPSPLLLGPDVTLRDFFAGLVMAQAMVVQSPAFVRHIADSGLDAPRYCARLAYQCADAMLRERGTR